MSEKAEKKEAPKKDEKGGEEKKGGGLLTKTPVLLGGVMAIQAVIVLAGVKLLMPAPAPAAAAVTVAGEEHAEGGGESTAAEGSHGGGEAKTESHGGGDEKGAKTEAKTFDSKKQYEIKLIEIKAPNKLSGRTFLYDMQIVVMVKGKVAKDLEKTISEREALIRDRIRTIIAQSDPEKLGGGSEPGLETLRRQIKYMLDEIIDDGKGESKIDEVLIPRCIPYRTDY